MSRIPPHVNQTPVTMVIVTGMPIATICQNVDHHAVGHGAMRFQIVPTISTITHQVLHAKRPSAIHLSPLVNVSSKPIHLPHDVLCPASVTGTGRSPTKGL